MAEVLTSVEGSMTRQELLGNKDNFDKLGNNYLYCPVQIIFQPGNEDKFYKQVSGSPPRLVGGPLE